MKRYSIPGIILLYAFFLAPAPAAAQYTFLCDPAYENCRTPLIDLIRQETVGIDVAFWFMEDTRYSSELIAKWNAGVPVRVTMDTEAFPMYPLSKAAVDAMKNAGIPIRNKSGGNGILHFKTMIFAGQNVVEYSGANYSDEAFVYRQPYSNYVDEVIIFSDEASIVNSFKTRYDDIWTDTTQFSDWANITAPPARVYPTSPIDPELNFVPWNSFATRSVNRYKAETQKIDSIMYRITDRRHSDQMIAVEQRGVQVRLITEPMQYRDPTRLWHSWNVDRMYMAGVEVRFRKHLGLSHEKMTLLYGQNMVILGSSNWTSASGEGQHEHNIFSTKQWMFDWARDHFERKWNNLGAAEETEPFVPLPPDVAVVKAPADAAQDQALSVALKWYAGPWAHRYDVYFGASPTSLTKVVNDQELGPSQSTTDYKTWTASNLAAGTTYYWKVVSRTMANLERTSPTWSFRTQGAPPSTGANDVVLWAWRAPSASGWSAVTDGTAAGGKRLSNPNAGAPKLSAPLASPTQFFDLGFNATAGIPYRLWIRGKATSNSYENDSVYVQFSDSTTSGAAPTWRIGSTSAATVTIEDCSGCGLSNWGWNDTAVGQGVLGPLVYFETTGVHTIRVQVREDGLSIDQIILSPNAFLNASPGQPLADGTIYNEQNGATLTPNNPPTVSLIGPANGASFTAPATVTVDATAGDSDGTIVNVDFFANGTLIGSDASSPYQITWSAGAPGTYTVTARATDSGGASTTSSGRQVVINNGSVQPGEEIVLYASTAPTTAGWNVVADATAAGGNRLQNPNAGAAKLSAPLAAPTQYFELTFNALAGKPYRLWVRGKATSNGYDNDSVYVQFDGSVTNTGVPTYRIGTTSATTVTIEDATSAGLSGWGWNDNGYGAGVLGPTVYFATSGTQRIRVQVREDGLGIDQIVLSSSYYLNAAPGATKNDTTILPATP